MREKQKHYLYNMTQINKKEIYIYNHKNIESMFIINLAWNNKHIKVKNNNLSKLTKQNKKSSKRKKKNKNKNKYFIIFLFSKWKKKQATNLKIT